MASANHISMASAMRNLGDQGPGLEAIAWKTGATILDIGCGPGVHLDYFRQKGLIGTGLDRTPDYFRFHGEIEHVSDIAQLSGREFDYVFASHVLEHCPNTFEALAGWRALLKPEGTMIIFVPPFFNEVSNDHWVTGWNVGQLAMTMVAAGFDCRHSTFYQTADQVFGFGVKKPTPATFMIDESLPCLPPAMANGKYQGEGYQNLRADIAYVSGDRIEYLPRRSESVAVPLPDESWLSAHLEKSRDAIAQPRLPISPDGSYELAVEAAEDGFIRIALCHDNFQEHGELWLELKPGLNIRQFECVELTAPTSRFSPERTDAVVIGGPGTFIRAALFRSGARVA